MRNREKKTKKNHTTTGKRQSMEVYIKTNKKDCWASNSVSTDTLLTIVLIRYGREQSTVPGAGSQALCHYLVANEPNITPVYV